MRYTGTYVHKLRYTLIAELGARISIAMHNNEYWNGEVDILWVLGASKVHRYKLHAWGCTLQAEMRAGVAIAML